MSAKAALRKDLIAARRIAANGENGRAGASLARVFLREGPEISPGTVISAFWPIKTEINVVPLMDKLAEAEASICLPVAPDRFGDVEFRRYGPGTAMTADAWGIPGPDFESEVLTPQVMLVPLLGFDSAGGRIGYGAGIYDRAIAKFRAGLRANGGPNGGLVTVGIAYAAQEVARVPMEASDQRLDWVITEKGVKARP